MRRIASVAGAAGIADLARRPVVRDLSFTFGGRVAQMLLALVGSVVSARALGPEDLGRFGLVMTTVTICGTLADAGLTYTAVRYIARYSERDTARAQAAARAYLLLRLLTGAATSLAGLLLSEVIAGAVLGHADLTPYLQLAFFTLFGLAISSYPGTVLVGLARFGRVGLAGVLNAAITVAGILLLLAAGRLDLTTLVAWNVVLPVVSTLPAWLMLPSNWLPWRLGRAGVLASTQAGVMREVLGFSKWMAIAMLGSIVASQGDLILLGRLAGPAVVGVYSVALTLALRLDTLNQSLMTVMMPRASRLGGPAEIRRYSRRVLGGSLLLAGFVGVVALLAQPLIALLYGERYEASAGLFLALVVVVLFDLVTSSLFLVALPLNRPRVLAVSDWLRVLALGLAGWLLIPAHSGYGAVASRLISRVAGAAYTLLALRRSVPPAPDEAEADRTAASNWAS
jgi:O-antigen/teichoic acid export membrane protein